MTIRKQNSNDKHPAPDYNDGVSIVEISKFLIFWVAFFGVYFQLFA